MTFRTVGFLVLVSLCFSAKLPNSFQKCNRKQPDLKDCLLKAAQDGLSQLAQPVLKDLMPSINPIEIPEATIKEGQGAVEFQQSFKDCKIYGFHLVKLDAFDWNFEKKTLYMGGFYPEFKIHCHYDFVGKILVVPIEGSGQSRITMENVTSYMNLGYEETKKKGKTYVKFVSSEATLEPGLISFNFDNLFDGDKLLGDNVNKLLNENWKEVFEDVKGGYVDLIRQVFTSIVNSLFSKVSLEELLD
ncbi:hypothetical protein Zmor_016999 [Zophobas morio]|uniref:Uncharacterized protein n=1 Tax=Zophobas morio TaxID=2755281 RepID=A0AA38IBM0_9CUCU|nr:hypothetical protein Zmor_016999 [Zophobas morio]